MDAFIFNNGNWLAVLNIPIVNIKLENFIKELKPNKRVMTTWQGTWFVTIPDLVQYV